MCLFWAVRGREGSNFVRPGGLAVGPDRPDHSTRCLVDDCFEVGVDRFGYFAYIGSGVHLR